MARERRSSLTLRILTVNVIAPLVLMIGLLFMSQYRDNLIRAELETLKAQSQLFAGAISEGAVKPVPKGRPFLFARPEEMEVLIPELSRRMLRRLGENTDSRTRLFNDRGVMIGDSFQLIEGRGDDSRGKEGSWRFDAIRILRSLSRVALDVLPTKTALQTFSNVTTKRIQDYPDAIVSREGDVSGTAWQDAHGRIMLTASAPIMKSGRSLGVVHLTREGREIEEAMIQVRFDVVTVFLGALSITIFLSMYLAAAIGRPLKKLARAAEAVRLGQGRNIEIPDLSHRGDEIGELSNSLRDMTKALWERMDTIERFAADVSHEIKNPLTSLRSAVETVEVVKSKMDRDRLMDIIRHDVQRMDRLISDISAASRLDTELLREEMGPVDLGALLMKLADAHRQPLARVSDEGNGEDAVRLILPAPGMAVVRGNDSRLARGFDNLITNAISFSPPGRPILITVGLTENREQICITVEDEGPGIPENKLENIFERFYTERPKHEDYGSHSGLGLSIARQIFRAHGGTVKAENIRSVDGSVTGARFIVTLSRMA
jgi:two-component system sensor histidine kinase ChvG